MSEMIHNRKVTINYQKEYMLDGAKIETIVYYRDDSHIVPSPKESLKEVEKIMKVVKETGIAKLTVTAIDDD